MFLTYPLGLWLAFTDARIGRGFGWGCGWLCCSTTASRLDGAPPWQRFVHVTLPMLMPVLSVVLTFSVLFTFTDFQLVYAITRGGPVNSTHLMATLAFQRGIPGGW